jgi:crotonobetainyl-CoA:carnitine CoA-transferase CaiB-like acyl-CoA transferase
VSLSGYGAQGPRAQWPGHDINYLAAAGVVGMAMKGDVVPSFGVPVADLAGATYALAALQAALLQRSRTGRGQHLDVSLTDCAAHWMNPRLAALHDAGGDAALVRRQVQQRPGYGVFRCRDGQFITVAALEDHFWQALVRTLPLPTHELMARYADRVPQAEAINGAIAAALLKEDASSALQRLAAADVPVAEVTGLAEVSRSEVWATRRLFVETEVGPLARFPVVLEGMCIHR